MASQIKNKSVVDIRKYFNIENDFTPEEEAQIQEENRWAEESFWVSKVQVKEDLLVAGANLLFAGDTDPAVCWLL